MTFSSNTYLRGRAGWPTGQRGDYLEACVSLSASTTITLIAAVAGTYIDILSLVFDGPGASAPYSVFDGLASGTLRLVSRSPAGEASYYFPPLPLKMGTAGNAWAIESEPAAHITVQYVLNT